MGIKSAFLGKHYMVYIAYFTELNLQICDYVQKRRICRENCKYALDENFHDHFCPRRKAAKFCHPDSMLDSQSTSTKITSKKQQQQQQKITRSSEMNIALDINNHLRYIDLSR